MTGRLELAPGKFAHPSGALWLPDPASLLVAGAHLGFGWAERRRKEAKPVLDGGAHKRLEIVVDELKPRVIVFLGGVYHAASPAPKERAVVEGILRPLARRAAIVLVSGDHVRSVEEWRHSGVVAVHGGWPKEPVGRDEVLVLGHIHPSASIQDDAGNVRRLPAFLRSRRAIVLPAFSPLAGGVDVSHGVPGELREFLGRGPVQVAVTTGQRVVPIKLLGGG